jgi:hypothetical protein
MRKSLSLVPALSILALSSIAFGHGVQIQLTYDAAGNRLITREVVRTSAPNVASVTNEKRIYVMPVLATTLNVSGNPTLFHYTRPAADRNASGNPAFPSGPGLTWAYEVVDPTVASPVTQIPGTGFALRNSSTLVNLGGSNFSYTPLSPLNVWSGSAWVDPGTESIQFLSGDGTNPAAQTPAVTLSGSAPSGALNFGAINANPATLPGAASRPHNSATFRMLNNGQTDLPGDPGVYLFSLRVATTALSPTGSPINPADPIYFVLANGVSLESAALVASDFAATNDIAYSFIQVVPEPTTLALLTAPALLMTRRRR